MATLHYNSLSYPLESVFIYIYRHFSKTGRQFCCLQYSGWFCTVDDVVQWHSYILPQCIRTQQAIQLNSIKIETFDMHFDALFWFGSNSGKFVKFRWFVTQRKQIKTIRVIAFQLLQLGFQVFGVLHAVFMCTIHRYYKYTVKGKKLSKRQIEPF